MAEPLSNSQIRDNNMDSTLLAAIIGAIATVAAVLIGWYLQRPKPAPPTIAPVITEQQSNEETESQSFARRYLEYPSHYRFIKSLPKLRAVVLENAGEGWDTGVTSEMRDASYDVTAFLEYAWLRIAEFYPDRHWGGSRPKTTFRPTFKGDTRSTGPSMSLVVQEPEERSWGYSLATTLSKIWRA